MLESYLSSLPLIRDSSMYLRAYPFRHIRVQSTIKTAAPQFKMRHVSVSAANLFPI